MVAYLGLGHKQLEIKLIINKYESKMVNKPV